MRRRYIKPKLTRVKLNPEQAVLSQCSASWAEAKDSVLNRCADSGCRQKNAGGAATAGS